MPEICGNPTPIVQLYLNSSAAGSRLTTCTVRPVFSQCCCIVSQYVDLPLPAGPITSCAYLPMVDADSSAERTVDATQLKGQLRYSENQRG